MSENKYSEPLGDPNERIAEAKQFISPNSIVNSPGELITNAMRREQSNETERERYRKWTRREVERKRWMRENGVTVEAGGMIEFMAYRGAFEVAIGDRIDRVMNGKDPNKSPFLQYGSTQDAALRALCLANGWDVPEFLEEDK